jgi:hypothetical protein
MRVVIIAPHPPVRDYAAAIVANDRRIPARAEASVCGIAGCYQQADGQKLVDVMSERIAHRGPDAAGTWS